MLAKWIANAEAKEKALAQTHPHRPHNISEPYQPPERSKPLPKFVLTIHWDGGNEPVWREYDSKGKQVYRGLIGHFRDDQLVLFTDWEICKFHFFEEKHANRVIHLPSYWAGVCPMVKETKVTHADELYSLYTKQYPAGTDVLARFFFQHCRPERLLQTD